MTFGNYILRLRARLQDTRQTSGTAISLISQSGSRWSSTEIIEIANTAFAEVSRLLMLSESPINMQLGNDMLIAHGSGSTDSSGKLAVPSSVLAILSVEGTEPYGYVPPDKFFEYKLYAQPLLREEQYFTVVISSDIRYIFILPAEVKSITYTYSYVKRDYTVADTAVELYLQGIDDLLLDIAERECRDREHNWDRSKTLDARIAYKLGFKVGG